MDMVLQAGPFLYTDEVRSLRLDRVRPRGINRSRPLLCFRNLDEAFSVVWPFTFPFEPGEEEIAEQLDRALATACAERGGAIDDHMATADVARDLDLLRRKVGTAGSTSSATRTARSSASPTPACSPTG